MDYLEQTFHPLIQTSICPPSLPHSLLHENVLGETHHPQSIDRKSPWSLSTCPGRLGLSMPLLLNTATSPAGAEAAGRGRESHAATLLIGSVRPSEGLWILLLSLFHQLAGGHNQTGGTFTGKPCSAGFLAHLGLTLRELSQSSSSQGWSKSNHFLLGKLCCAIDCALQMTLPSLPAL